MKKTILITLILFAFSRIFSQNNVGSSEVHIIHCSYFGISKPLSEISESQIDSKDAKENEREESEDRLNRPPQLFKYHAKDGAEYSEDPAVRQVTMGTRPSLGPIVNWAGQSGNAYPPDPTGAAGPNHYVQGVNSTFISVINKTTGAQLRNISLGQLWSPAVTNQGDVIVLYDKYADRWFLSQFGNGTPNKIYIAISTSPDPTGTYYTYTFNSTEFPDYLKFSIWDDGYYMTSNQTADKVFCFERDQMLLGNAAARAISANFNTGTVSSFFIPMPADADGQLPPANTPLPFFAYYDNAWGGGADAIKIWSMSVNWVPTTPIAVITTTPTVVPTSAFDAGYDAGWNDIPQHGTTQRLDGLGGICMFRAQWRKWTNYNSVVLNFAVQISASPIQRGIRWCELRQDQITNQWTLYQEGTYSPDALCRWNGSIAMDGNGSIGLCYALCDSATSVSASLGFTGRLASDPLGTMTFNEKVVIAGSGAQTANNRFGDYSQTSIDPADDYTFWHTGEYFVSGMPRTRIYTFQLPLGAGIAEYENGNAGINAFQSDNTITVTASNLPSNDEYVVDLFDAGGKLIAGRKAISSNNSFDINIDISAFAKGAYLIRVGKINSSFQRVKKIIIK